MKTSIVFSAAPLVSSGSNTALDIWHCPLPYWIKAELQKRGGGWMLVINAGVSYPVLLPEEQTACTSCTASGSFHMCMHVCVPEGVWHVHIHMDARPSSVHHRQLNQEGEEYFSWCYFYDNLFRWLIWFRTLIYRQFIDLSLSLFLLSYWIIRMACVKWNFLAYCSASHATGVVQTIKRSIKLIYTQSERGKRGTEMENGECFGIGYHVYLSLVKFRIKIYMRKA